MTLPDMRDEPRAGACYVDLPVWNNLHTMETWRVPAIDTGRLLFVYLIDGTICALPPQTPRWSRWPFQFDESDFK